MILTLPRKSQTVRFLAIKSSVNVKYPELRDQNLNCTSLGHSSPYVSELAQY